MDLKPIAEQNYYTFAQHFFTQRGGSLSEALFHDIYSNLEGHTWYIQTLLKVLYANYDTVDKTEQVKAALQEIIQTNAAYYSSLLPLLTQKQQEVVRAIAQEGVVTAPTAGRFVHRYQLKSASTVKSALDALVEKEIIYHSPKGYTVYDRFLGMWLRQQR